MYFHGSGGVKCHTSAKAPGSLPPSHCALGHFPVLFLLVPFFSSLPSYFAFARDLVELIVTDTGPRWCGWYVWVVSCGLGPC